jgi:prepilin-type N-terminal cleavage/methylation domain-containing protein
MKKPAFTLVELIVVITILSILATFGFISYSSYIESSRDASRIAQIKNISDSLQIYSVNESLPIPDEYIEIRASS